MSSTAQARQPSSVASTSALPRSTTLGRTGSFNTNTTALSRSTTATMTTRTLSRAPVQGAPRRITSQPRTIGPSTSDAAPTPAPATGPFTVRKPRRILQSVQETGLESNQEPPKRNGTDFFRFHRSLARLRRPLRPLLTRDLFVDLDATLSKSRSLRPPTSLRPTPAATTTPLRRSRLSRSITSNDHSPTTMTTSTASKSRTIPLDTPRRRSSSQSSNREMTKREKIKDRIASSSGSTPRKSSALGTPKTVRKPSTRLSTNLEQPDPIRTSTSSTLMKPPAARRIPVSSALTVAPDLSTLPTSSSIPEPLARKSLKTSSLTSTSSTRTTLERKEVSRIGLGRPPTATTATSKKFSTTTNRPQGTKTPRGSSTMKRTTTTPNEESTTTTRSRTSLGRRESWETVGANSNGSRSRSVSNASLIMTTTKQDRTENIGSNYPSLSESLRSNHQVENRHISRLRRSELEGGFESNTPGGRGPTARTGRGKARGSTTLEELLQHGLLSFGTSSSSPRGGGGTSKTNPLSTSTSSRNNCDLAQSGSRNHTGFEFLMDENLGNLIEPIPGDHDSDDDDEEHFEIRGTPWRARVVSLNLSTKGHDQGGLGPKKRLFESTTTIDPQDFFETEPIDPTSVTRLAEQESTQVEEEEEGPRTREVLVLEPVGQLEQLDKLRHEHHLIELELERLRLSHARLELDHETQMKQWQIEKLEYENRLEPSSSAAAAGARSKSEEEVRIGTIEGKAKYEQCRASYEQVVSNAVRERDELVGTLEALRLIGQGLNMWQEVVL
ncbi:uncharacterized protein JCM15063_001344 [Sporobolomyces koalae]|uniref:uncharacterized protein n=1 Tax=Sporobolomyces koalae TaxID=500713 RepID=UPI00317CEE0A